jgi:hypothetical protein
MNSDINISRKYTGEWFKEMANQFVGLQATIFAYSPGFCDLYIIFEKGGRYFLLKFSHITYIKTHIEWKFGGIEFERIPEKIKGNFDQYKFYEQNYFEVVCSFFSVLEIVNGQDILDN